MEVMVTARLLGVTPLMVMTVTALLAGVEILTAMMVTARLVGVTPLMVMTAIVHSLGEIPPMAATERHVSHGATQFIVTDDHCL